MKPHSLRSIKHLILILFIFFGIPAFGGSAEHLLNLSAGTASGHWTLGLSSHHRYRFALPIFVGGGARAFHAGAWRDVLYEEAPEGGRTLLIDRPNSQSVNAFFELGIQPIPIFELGVNIDLVGFTLGGGSGGVNPSTLNLMLGGKHDKGTLNSEFYCGFRLQRLGFRAGLQHLIREVTSAGTRYRRVQNLFFLAVAFHY